VDVNVCIGTKTSTVPDELPDGLARVVVDETPPRVVVIVW